MQTEAKPRFQVEEIKNRKVTYELTTWDKDTRQFVRTPKTETIAKSYLVYFPQGHSLWFRDKASMIAANISDGSDFEIDMQTGLPIMPENIPDLKSLVERATVKHLED